MEHPLPVTRKNLTFLGVIMLPLWPGMNAFTVVFQSARISEFPTVEHEFHNRIHSDSHYRRRRGRGNASGHPPKTPPGQMRYDKAQFSVPPGARVVLTLENNDEMPHNVVICKPGDDKGMEVAKQAWAMGEQGMVKDWVPDHERVLVSGKMAPPHGQQSYAFTAPTEPGNYPYVCTFPGHAMTMNGTMRVAAEGPKIHELAFKLYLGSWNKLPDFSKLAPSREGKLPENLMGWKFDDYKNEFGVVFNGNLKAPKAGDYQFFLSSDDGSDLLIDGKSVIKADGIHPAGDVQTRTFPLQAGEHTLEVRYFQGGGEA